MSQNTTCCIITEIDIAKVDFQSAANGHVITQPIAKHYIQFVKKMTGETPEVRSDKRYPKDILKISQIS